MTKTQPHTFHGKSLPISMKMAILSVTMWQADGV